MYKNLINDTIKLLQRNNPAAVKTYKDNIDWNKEIMEREMDFDRLYNLTLYSCYSADLVSGYISHRYTKRLFPRYRTCIRISFEDC